MNKQVIFIFIGCFVVGALIGFAWSRMTTPKTLKIQMQTNGGVPYVWKYEIEGEDIVEFVKSYEVEDQNKDGLVGAPIVTEYVFQGKKEGTAKITFRYVHVAGEDIAKEEVHEVKVDKNKNVTEIHKTEKTYD